MSSCRAMGGRAGLWATAAARPAPTLSPATTRRPGVEVRRCAARRPPDRRQRVLEGGGEGVFRGEPVVDGQEPQPGPAG